MRYVAITGIHIIAESFSISFNIFLLTVPQVDTYLKEITDDVVKNLTSNQWRVRESR